MLYGIVISEYENAFYFNTNYNFSKCLAQMLLHCNYLTINITGILKTFDSWIFKDSLGRLKWPLVQKQIFIIMTCVVTNVYVIQKLL